MSTFSFGGGMGTGGCPPFSPCWCLEHPTHTNCNPQIPINNELWILLVAGLLFGLKKMYDLNKQKVDS